MISLAFSPDSKTLAAASSESPEISLWDLETMKERGKLEPPVPKFSNVVGLFFATSGEKLYSLGFGGLIAVWDMTSDVTPEAWVMHGQWDWVHAVSADRSTLVTIKDGLRAPIAYLWSLAEMKKIDEFPLDESRSKISAISIDRTNDALYAGLSGRITAWRTSSHVKSGDNIVHEDEITDLALSPTGEALVSGSRDGVVRVGSRDDAFNITRFHNNAVSDVDFSPDGTMVAAASWDGRVSIWKRTDGRMSRLKTGAENKNAFQMSPSSKYVVVQGPHSALHIVDTFEERTSKWLSGHTKDVGGIAVSWNDKLLATTSRDGTGRIWDLTDDGGVVFQTESDFGARSPVAFSNRAKYAAFAKAAPEPGIVLVDVKREHELHLQSSHDQSITGMAFSADDRQLVTCSEDATCEFWGVEDQRLLKSVNVGGSVNAVSLSPDRGQLALACGDGLVRVMDLATGAVLYSLGWGPTPVKDVHFSRDGKRLIAAAYREDMRLWDLERKTALLDMKLDDTNITAARLHPNGAQALSFVGTGDVFIWPLEFELEDKDLDELLEESEKEAGMKLEGFDLVPLEAE